MSALAPLLLATQVDWTQVLLLGIPAYIGAIGGAVAAIIASINRRQLKTPSGANIGGLAERTHHLAEVNALRSARIDKAMNGETVYDEEKPDA